VAGPDAEMVEMWGIREPFSFASGVLEGTFFSS